MKASGEGKVFSSGWNESVFARREKYSSHSDRPEKVLLRNGRREVAHEGPCSVIFGDKAKKVSRVSGGDLP